MDSFELNKILGAVLGTCLLLLVTSFTASALFSPKMPEKPGFEIAVKEDAGHGKEGGGRESRGGSPRPREGRAAHPPLPRSRSKNCSRPPRSRRAPPPPRSAAP